MRLNRIVYGCVAGVVFGAAACAQTETKPSSAAAALDAMVAAFAKAEAMSAEADGIAQMGKDPEQRFTLRFTVKRPSFARYEIAQTKPGGGSGLYVGDGKQFWTYDPVEKSYYSTPLDEKTKPIFYDGATGLSLVLQAFYDAPALVAGKASAPWSDLVSGAKAADADVAGEACTVVTLESKEGAITFSIAKATGLPRRIVDVIGSGADAARLTWEIAKVDTAPKVDDKTFVFTPPEGAKKMEGFEAPDASLLAVGEVAPDVSGRSPIADKDVKLSDFRGKVVLLNFWFQH